LTFLNLEFSNIYTNYNTNNSSNRYDINIINNNGDQIKIGYIPTPPTKIINKNNFYISINETIPTFYLSRIKINLKGDYCYNNNKNNNIYSKDIPGELIDVSISKEEKTFVYINSLNTKHKNTDIEIVQYKLNKPNIELIFNSYSLNCFINDLFRIIFIQTNINETKIKKRINRLLLLCFIQANIQDNKIITPELLTIIEDIICFLNEPSINININIKKYYGFNIFYDHLINILNDKKTKTKTETEIQKIKDYSLIVLTEIIKLKYHNNNLTNTTDLYNITKIGGGDYKYKYLKYKKKYINMVGGKVNI
jgi:hypothetical protein